MIKKIKEKKGYQKYTELRKNPQTKAIMSLVFWLLFFSVLIMTARSIPKNSKNMEKRTNINSYEYTYSNDKIKIFGKFYDNKQLFILNGEKYYYDSKTIYKVDGQIMQPQDFDLNILKININMIDNLTNKLNEINENMYKRYIVPLNNFINLYDGDTEVNISDASSYNIIIDKYYKKGKIYLIKLDLSNYYKYKNIENEGILNIYLYNVNSLSSNLKEYEDMLGGVT